MDQSMDQYNKDPIENVKAKLVLFSQFEKTNDLRTSGFANKYILHMQDDKGLYKFDTHLKLVIGAEFKSTNETDNTRVPNFKFRRAHLNAPKD
jgi:hypothetical protein